MAKKIIRRSPSGPVIGELGPGALIRMAEGSYTGSQSYSDTPSIVGAGFPDSALGVSLDEPKADLEYRVECEFSLNAGDTGTQTVTVELLATYDGGTPEVIETLPLTVTGNNGALHVHARFPLAALPNMPEGTQVVAFSCQVTTGSGGDLVLNTGASARAYMSAEEHVPQAALIII